MDVSSITKRRITEYLAEGKRFDSRKLIEHREIKIELGISNKADGSARVKFGDTEVLAGIKMDVLKPYPDSQDAGVMSVTVELLPLASENFELGPPGIEAVELARIVDRGIRESGFIDFKKLCIKEGEKVWTLFIDIYPINDAGNLIDAACLAAAAALKDAKIPKYDEEKERVQFGELSSKKLPLNENLPIAFTFHKIGKSLITDPVTEEQEASEARLTVTLSQKGKDVMINSLQKGKATVFSQDEVFHIFDSAEKEFKKLLPAVISKLESK